MTVDERIDKILKREQEYVQQCTLANIQAARETGQWIIHDPNRAQALKEIKQLITEAKIEELANLHTAFNREATPSTAPRQVYEASKLDGYIYEQIATLKKELK